MARQKRGSRILEYAERRLVALESIDTSLDLGDNLTLQFITQLIDSTRTKLKTYNAALTEIDQLKEFVQQQERSLEELIDRMANGVAAKYGRNSQQYKTVSSVRKIRRRTPRTVVPIQQTELSA